MEGVRPQDYKLWETNPQAATASWKTWRSELNSMDFESIIEHRIPKLSPILAILKGDFSTAASLMGDWPNAVCAELLYQRPNLRPQDLEVRIKETMKLFGSENGNFESIVLSVLQGDAGRVVSALHQLGGGSGAALPAVVVSFFY